MLKKVVLFLAVIAASGCGDRITQSESDPRQVSVIPQERFLPYGVSIPEHLAISLPPEPYSRSKHGPALRSTIGTYRREVPGRDVPLRFMQRQPSPLMNQSQGAYRGFWLYNITKDWHGVNVVKDVQLDLTIPPPGPRGVIYVYSPTTLPPSGACIEGLVRHDRYASSTETLHYLAWFDWCQYGTTGQWFLAPIDANFQSKYVRTYQGEPTLAMNFVTPTNPGQTCWYAHLYNYQVGGWEQLYSSCGTTNTGYGDAGWTMWEAYNVGEAYCPWMQSIRAMNIEFADPSSSWVPFTNYTSDYSQLGPIGDCWPTGNYTFSTPVPGLSANSWRAETPYP